MKKIVPILGLLVIVLFAKVETPELFPMENNFSKEYLVENFWKCRYTSAGKEYSYAVILPKNVKPTHIEPTVLSDVNLTSIGIYNTIDTGAYMEVWVAYESLTQYVEPMQWLFDKIKRTGETVLSYHVVEGKEGEKYLDVLTIKTIKNNESVISRFTVFRNNLNYFTLKASCNVNDYGTLAQTIQHITSSWKLTYTHKTSIKERIIGHVKNKHPIHH